jgi:hypothetical protein
MRTHPRRYCVLTLCLLGCGGAAREDKKTNAMGIPPAVSGSAGAEAAVLSGTSGSAGSSAGASGLAEGGSAGVAADQAGTAGTTADAGSFTCGASTCTASQLCVARQCGGGPVQCMEQTDGGCPPGWHSEICPGGPFKNRSACVPDLCTPPAPECIDMPSGCASTPNCMCLDQTSICQSVGCQSVVARHVTCNGAE